MRNQDGQVVADSAGKGGELQSVASTLFEAWEHYWGFHALAELRLSGARVLAIEEIVSQPELAADKLLVRLAKDFPGALLGCLFFESMARSPDGVWYPVFPKNPAFRRYPVPGDDRRYSPYDRYSTNNGTASGMTVEDALLHAMLESIERDAISFALIDWYARLTPIARRVDSADLPADLAGLLGDIASLFGMEPAILDITTDIDVPVYCALPPHSLFPHANNFGAGASLSAAYAVERALTELVQFTLAGKLSRYMNAHRRALGRLAQWPLIARCAEQDPATPLRHAERANSHDCWDPPRGTVKDQLSEICDRLQRRGLQAYWLRWDPNTTVPVVCVLIPGLETFFLARQGVPVLPTGRATDLLLAMR